MSEEIRVLLEAYAHKCEIEDALDSPVEELHNLIKRQVKFVRNILYTVVTMPVIATETLSKEEFESKSAVCGICLENHTKGSTTVSRNCKHEFGTVCFTHWANFCKNQKKNVSCPSCRQSVTQVTQFLYFCN